MAGSPGKQPALAPPGIFGRVFGRFGGADLGVDLMGVGRPVPDCGADEAYRDAGVLGDQVEQVILQDLPGRLASALLGLTEKRKLEPQSHTIAITQQEISEMVGMTRESINKQLRAWAARNWVRLEHGAIVVLDADALRELSESGSAANA